MRMERSVWVLGTVFGWNHRKNLKTSNTRKEILVFYLL
jgi:hypothetical protein